MSYEPVHTKIYTACLIIVVRGAYYDSINTYEPWFFRARDNTQGMSTTAIDICQYGLTNYLKLI